MIIVAGYLLVDPGEREAYLRGCVDVIRQARTTPGCHVFAISHLKRPPRDAGSPCANRVITARNGPNRRPSAACRRESHRPHHARRRSAANRRGAP